MIDYYDRQGKPISQNDWLSLRLFKDIKYKIVARHQDNRVLISTVWLGLNQAWGGGPPLIFETMIFAEDPDIPYHDCQWRWTTEEEAKEAHEIIVNCYHENQNPEQAINQWRERRSNGKESKSRSARSRS